MTKSSTIYVCAECGNEELSWQGRCVACNQWNTFKEFKIKNQKSTDATKRDLEWIQSSAVVDLNVWANSQQRDDERIHAGDEVDRVLGGGMVAGSVNLLAGEPGIGKSTLLLQIAHKVGKIGEVLYVSGEESINQVIARAKRLGVKGSSIKLVSLADVDQILEVMAVNQPKLFIIDSIQTVYDETFPSAPGSIVQVRQSALKLTRFAKNQGIPLLLASHVTKEGTLAGPRALEHMVDVVLYIEGDRFQDLRMLRGIKNRYGPTDEVGVFQMEQRGLRAIASPSEIFLSQRQEHSSGSVVTAVIEGMRPFLLEVQALATPAKFGYPKRRTIGIDVDRLELVLAVLEKRAKIKVSNYDIFCSVVGGLKVKEPAIDVAVAVAVASSIKNLPINPKKIFYGEIGLTGEIRSVRLEQRRTKEASRFGFEVSQYKDISTILKKLQLIT